MAREWPTVLPTGRPWPRAEMGRELTEMPPPEDEAVVAAQAAAEIGET